LLKFEAIARFVNERSKLCPQLEGGGRIQDLMCLTDIMGYLQTGLNHRKKMKTELIWLIPQKLMAN